MSGFWVAQMSSKSTKMIQSGSQCFRVGQSVSKWVRVFQSGSEHGLVHPKLQHFFTFILCDITGDSMDNFGKDNEITYEEGKIGDYDSDCTSKLNNLSLGILQYMSSKSNSEVY